MKQALGNLAVERMKAYVDAHLLEPMTLRDIAGAVGYSQYYAARLFKEETGESLFAYVRRSRLLLSAHMLRSEKGKVLDVALDFVFDSHEGFTRAFANAFGITPKKYAAYPDPDGWLIPYHYLNRNRQHKQRTEEQKMEQKTSVIFTQIVERPARKLILKRSKSATHYMEYVEEFGCGTPENPDPWSILCGIKEAIYEPVGVWLPENMRPEGTGVYAHGVEVPADYQGTIPEGFDVIDLEPCLLLVFQGEPYDDEYYEEAVGLCMEQIKKFNPEVYGYRYAPQLAPKMQLAPMGWRGYIELHPIEKVNA